MSTKGRKFPAESLQREEMDALLEKCGDSRIGKRNRALIVSMWRSGLRLSEALALQPRDIDWDAKTIRVLHGKGDKARTVAFDEGAKEVLNEWRQVRNAPVGSPFFCTNKGTPVDASYVRAFLPRLAKKAGVEARVHAHVFRHTFAVDLARAGVPLPYIQRLLGHTSLATTSVYLASLSPEEALDAVRGRTW